MFTDDVEESLDISPSQQINTLSNLLSLTSVSRRRKTINIANNSTTRMSGRKQISMTVQMTPNPTDPTHGCRWSSHQASFRKQMESEATSSPSTETNAAVLVDNNSGISHN